MKSILKSSLLLLFLLLTIVSCSNDKKSEKKTHSTTATENHLEEVTLTKEQMNAVNISLGQVENKELTSTLQANGTLIVPNNNKANVTSMFGGVVRTLNVEFGDKVHKGQIIATIANAQFIQVQEDYLSTKSELTMATQELQRQQTLHSGNAGALKNLQSATAAQQALKVKKAALRQQLQLMGIDAEKLTAETLRSSLSIQSPINGVISQIYGKIGSFVDASTPLAEIVDNSSLHLDLQVFEKDIPKLKNGQIIHFTLTNNPVKEYDAVIFNIGASFENESKTITVHCDVTGDKNGLIDGMNVSGIVSLEKATMPAVPNDAIVNYDNKDFVFAVEDQNDKEVKFKRLEVIKGVSNMGFTAITFVQNVKYNLPIATSNVFFINAKMTNSNDHEH